jgi:hypothetical protein
MVVQSLVKKKVKSKIKEIPTYMENAKKLADRGVQWAKDFIKQKNPTQAKYDSALKKHNKGTDRRVKRETTFVTSTPQGKGKIKQTQDKRISTDTKTQDSSGKLTGMFSGNVVQTKKEITNINKKIANGIPLTRRERRLIPGLNKKMQNIAKKEKQQIDEGSLRFSGPNAANQIKRITETASGAKKAIERKYGGKVKKLQSGGRVGAPRGTGAALRGFGKGYK